MNLQHLQADIRCAIHGLVEKGYPGCARLRLLRRRPARHAGTVRGCQLVASPDIAREMFECYERLRPLHELMAMATFALDRTADVAHREALREAVSRIDGLCTLEGRPDIVQVRHETIDLLRRALADQEKPVRS